MKEVFSRIAQSHPNSALSDRFGDGKTVKEKKANSIAKKHGIV